MKKVAFIGVGNMGGILARSACQAVGPEEVVVTNRTYEKAAELARETGCQAVGTNREAAKDAACVFLCVKPKLMRGVMEELADQLKGRTVVSVAAGVPLSDLVAWAPDSIVLRLMPNTCAAVGKGMLALTAGAGVKEERYVQVEELLAAAGRTERIGEELMDQFSALAGCGPAFVYPYIEALADGGVKTGLPRAKALAYAAQTVLGAAAMVLETGEHPGKLKDDVCSPGGSTIAGVAVLEEHGLRAAAIDAVTAAFEKTKGLGK